jgi:hypothetical protein
MRKFFAVAVAALAALFALPAVAADIPHYPPIIEIPPVDYGYGGNFYLRGSGGLNIFKAWEVQSWDCVACTGLTEVTYPVASHGYGYSVGAGLGFETGTGLRFDATIDYLDNSDASIVKTNPAVAGTYSLRLRSTVALANVYYDFGFGGSGGGFGHGYSAAGGAFGYVGAGAGLAFNRSDVTGPTTNPIPSGSNTSFAAAGMTGIGYDFGAFTTDIGYRALYIASITNNAGPPNGFTVPGSLTHEVRGTVRYRF